MFRWTWVKLAYGLLSAIALVALSSPAGAAELQLLIKEDFEGGAARWQPTDERAWKVMATPQGKVYSLFQQSDYKPPYRSPLNFSLLKGVVVADFVLEAKVQSTVKPYDHRDMVMVFGYQDPAHYYYVHFGKKTDDHANQIFIVNAAPRVKISTKTTSGTPWDDEWHPIKIVRTVADGHIEVYFDDLKNPVMTASDKTFAWGQVGVGSFDDTGNYDDVILRGVAATRGKPVK